MGQHIAVLPKLDLVVAHKTRPGQRDSTGRELRADASFDQWVSA
jgi:hypothetical protein